MCFFFSPMPATFCVTIGYFVLLASSKAAGGIKAFGIVLFLMVERPHSSGTSCLRVEHVSGAAACANFAYARAPNRRGYFREVGSSHSADSDKCPSLHRKQPGQRR